MFAVVDLLVPLLSAAGVLGTSLSAEAPHPSDHQHVSKV